MVKRDKRTIFKGTGIVFYFVRFTFRSESRIFRSHKNLRNWATGCQPYIIAEKTMEEQSKKTIVVKMADDKDPKAMEDNPEKASGIDKIDQKEEDVVWSSVEKESNFTWANFFTEHCGVLPEDSCEYEKHLIAHRLSPVDTLLESIGLIIEYGQIPIGDKLKIMKSIKRITDDLEKTEKSIADAARTLGLEKYSEFQAGMILNFAEGKTEDWAIDYGIEMLESSMEELKKCTAVALLTDPKAKEACAAGKSAARQHRDPVLRLLRSLGYTSFDYTRNKVVGSRRPQTKTLSTSGAADLILGNVDDDVPEQMTQEAVAMYS